MTQFAGWSFLGSASSMISNYGQGIVMNMFFGTLVNAAQGIANQISGQLGAFASTMIKALNPLIAKSEGSGNRELMIKASMMGSKVSFFLLMLFYIPVLIEMPFIFKLWLKVVPKDAVIFCTLLLIRMLIEQLFITLTSSIAAVGRIKRFQLYNSILNFAPLVAGFVLFKIGYPPYFIYIVFIIYSILSSGVILYFARKDCSLSISFFFSNVIFRCSVAFITTILISTLPIFLMNEGINRLFFVLIINITIFILSVWFIGFSNSERLNILSMVKNTLEKKENL
jgi:hypothetical protein